MSQSSVDTNATSAHLLKISPDTVLFWMESWHTDAWTHWHNTLINARLISSQIKNMSVLFVQKDMKSRWSPLVKLTDLAALIPRLKLSQTVSSTLLTRLLDTHAVNVALDGRHIKFLEKLNAFLKVLDVPLEPPKNLSMVNMNVYRTMLWMISARLIPRVAKIIYVVNAMMDTQRKIFT